MSKRLVIVAAVLAGLWFVASSTAQAQQPVNPYGVPWHNAYYDRAWGQPVALVVPPTAGTQTQYGWGVGGTRTTPIVHQFSRAYPGYSAPGGGFYPTPYWPSDTTQFGVYYVRGPW